LACAALRAKEEDMLFAQPSPAQTNASPVLATSATEWLTSISRRVNAWASACADYYSAAALYDELRGLSDAELRRRGLSRDTLARDACQACDTLGGR
jgi:hypothetical protein